MTEPPAPCTQAMPTPAAGEPQRSRSTLTPSGLGPNQALDALQSVFLVSPLPRPARGPFPIMGCWRGSDHHSDLQLPLNPRESADVPGIPVSPTPQACPWRAFGWAGPSRRLATGRGGGGGTKGRPLSWAASPGVWEPGSRTRGICKMVAATSPRSPPRATLRTGAAAFPHPGTGLSQLLTETRFEAPVPSLLPSVPPVGPSPCSFHAVFGSQGMPRRRDTRNHPFITSVAAPAPRAPWKAAEVTLPSRGVEGTKQVHRALPWGSPARSTQSTSGSRSECIKL